MVDKDIQSSKLLKWALAIWFLIWALAAIPAFVSGLMACWEMVTR